MADNENPKGDKKDIKSQISDMINAIDQVRQKKDEENKNASLPIRDIAVLNQSFHEFLSKQLLVIVANHLFKNNPKKFISDVINHFETQYNTIISRRREKEELTWQGKSKEDMAAYKKMADIEKRNQTVNLERFVEKMNEMLTDLVSEDDFNDLW